MIRFACPGCAATFTVDDAKAGKVGKCPKCQSQFQIPSPDPTVAEDAPPAMPAAPPPSPTPPAAAAKPPVIAPVAPPSSTVEIAPCPKCSARLTVGLSDLGADVECPYCKTIYAATRGDALVPASAPIAKADDDFASLDDDDVRPSQRSASKRGRRDDDEDDRPSRRKSSRRDDEDDEDDRPSRRKKSRRRSRGGSNQESKRVTAGILALLLGGFGVHKFYLGYTGAGVIMLLLACVGISGFIALAEGIIYLTKSDEEFIETYQENTKEWF